MLKPILIRSMMQSDVEDFVKGFAAQNWHKPASLFEKYFYEQENEQRKVVVAEVDGEVAGYVTLLPAATVGPFAHERIPEIVDFNVLIKFQRKGIGNKIMDAVEEIAWDKSTVVSLAVGLHSGYGTAQRIYVKRGYIPDGTGVWYKGEQLAQYVTCENDDDLNLYFSKEF